MKRRALRLLLFVFAGAIINIAVAWGVAGFGHVPLFISATEIKSRCHDVSWAASPPTGFPSRPGYFATQASSAADRIEMIGFTTTEKDLEARRRNLQTSVAHLAENPSNSSLQEFVRREQEFQVVSEVGPSSSSCRLTQIRTGFPALSMAGFRWSTQTQSRPMKPPEKGVISAIEIQMNPMPIIPGLDEKRLLPFRPLWPGFAINTIFYAAILWMIFALPFAIRRRRRIKRGLCVKCAYPEGVASAVCSECGTPVHPTNAPHGAAALGGPASPARD